MLLLNALYARVAADPSLKLTIFTGLTLTRPRYGSLLEQRFVEPLLHRLFASYPEAAYVAPLKQNALPPNIKVVEFFLQAGAWLGNGAVQRAYTSMNYSNVAEHLEREGTNVFAQLVAPSQPADGTVSLASNTDITLDVMSYINRRRASGQPIAVVGEINENLPFMANEAVVSRTEFDVLLEPRAPHYDLFALPKEPVSLVDYAIALRVATLIKDGGTLQIGIGSFADALTHALVLRHTQNQTFRELVQALGEPSTPDAELGPFTQGLYGCTEMLIDGYLTLMDAGILKRHVTGAAGQPIALHAGFFLGNRLFYDRLKSMPMAERRRIGMTGIGFTNTLNGDDDRKREDRRDARFINTAMAATLLGAISSDALDDGRVVSGVGGQLDFVSLARQLPGARSIIAVRSARGRSGKRASNIVWTHRSMTIPRSLRDVIVTEHGIADVRGKSDRDTVVAMVSVADTAFQDELIRQATTAGKLEREFRLPTAWQHNRAPTIDERLGPARAKGLLPSFPLGTEMTDVERALVGPLQLLKAAGPSDIARHLLRGLRSSRDDARTAAALERLELDRPQSLQERFYATLVKGALALS